MLSALAHRMLRDHVHLWITFVFVSVSLDITKTSPQDHATLSAFHALCSWFTICIPCLLHPEEVGWLYTGMHCWQTHFITYYRFLGIARHCSISFRGSQNWRSISIIATKMASFRCIRGKNVSVLNGHELLFVQCVSKETLILIPSGLPCVELECRENSAMSIGCL